MNFLRITELMKLDKEKFRGCLLGLAVGDALGTTVEFSTRGTFEPMTDIVGGGPFSLEAGQWTDDTSMALCLGQSLVACQGMNLTDQLDRYINWWINGHNSVTGKCFDIGNTVRSALESFSVTDNPHSGSTDPMSAGNGSIMRLAPVPMFYAYDQLLAATAAAESSLTTHGAKDAVGACYVFSQLIAMALCGSSKEEILMSDAIVPLSEDAFTLGICAIVSGSYKSKEEIDIRGSGYVVESLEAALWAFWNSGTFEEGALLAVNLGDDADTTGAVYGQIAGAYYGEKNIPKHWKKKIAWRKKIINLADQLYLAASTSPAASSE